MNIDMDEELRSHQLRKLTDSRPSLAQWLFIIAFGVFLGNVASLGVDNAISYWEVKQIEKAASLAMQESNRKLVEARKIQETKIKEQKRLMAIQQQKRQYDQEQKRAAYMHAKETCNFWNQHLVTENTEKNRMYRDQACNLMNKFRY